MALLYVHLLYDTIYVQLFNSINTAPGFTEVLDLQLLSLDNSVEYTRHA